MSHEMHSVTLNIRYDIPASSWSTLAKVYESMPGWQGVGQDGCPVWQPDGPNGGDISASVEPSGLLFEANVSETTWVNWISDFIQRATIALGMTVKDADE
jgi:hypothetical protein